MIFIGDFGTCCCKHVRTHFSTFLSFVYLIFLLNIHSTLGVRQLEKLTRLWAGRLWFDYQQKQEMFLLATVSGSASHPVSYPMGTEVRWPDREADHHLHLVERTGVTGAVPPFPLTWCLISSMDSIALFAYAQTIFS
jgi:hypothetical protein